MKRYQAILAVAAFCVISSTSFAANLTVKAFDYTCVDANNGDKVTLHTNEAPYGGVDFRLEVRKDFQAVIQDAAPVNIKGYPGFYHPETSKSSELTVIVLDNGKQLALQYGPRVFTCGLSSEYNLVDNY